MKAKNDHKSQSTFKAAGENGAEGCTARVLVCAASTEQSEWQSPQKLVGFIVCVI